MPTMIYSPAIEVRIATANNGIIDVSDDIASGSLSLNENSSSSLSLTLTNHMRKYDGLFTPNDRITVKMKRVRWLQVFSGYLDSVPYFSIFPRDVVLEASDTLKRLKYRPWDPGSQAAYDLLSTTGQGFLGAQQVDGGIRDKVVRLLTDVAGWPKANIHLGQIPHDWFTTVTDLSAAVKAQTAGIDTQLGTTPIVAGAPLAEGTVSASNLGAPNAMCDLPAASGLISWFGGPNGGAYGGMALTGESGVSPANPWYAAMRWGYQGYVNGKITPRGSASDRRAAIAWLKNRKLIVTNPRSGKAICVRAADWGPGGVKTADNRAIDVSKAAMEALGVGTDSHVQIRWAASQDIPLGPVSTSEQARAGTPVAGRVKTVADAKEEREEQAAARASNASAATGNAPTASISNLSFADVPDGGGTLQGHASAARQFIKKNWPAVPSIGGYAYRNIAGTGKKSRHSTGHALDVMVNSGGKMPTTEQLKLGNAIAAWFTQNPGAFAVDEVIWNNHINTGRGWRLYNGGRYSGSPTLGHFDHVHISFRTDVSPTSVGAMGGGWPGSASSDPVFQAGFSTGQGLVPEGGEGGGGLGQSTNLLNTYNWQGAPDPASAILTGPRALLNDEPVLNTISTLCQVGMRHFMAGPNGDFIAWFPDYFDNYKIAAKLHISDVELAGDGFTVQHSDERLITHQFTAGTPVNTSSSFSGAVGLHQQVFTQGIATVEMTEIMEALFNVDASDPRSKKFTNGAGILNRYGARNDFVPMGTITGPQAEFWFALKLFMTNWAQQFSAAVYTTFMPEAWPGMILVVDSMKFQAYIAGVTHSWDFGGGGFTTQIRVVAPSALEGGLLGLPRAGGAKGKQNKAKPKPTKSKVIGKSAPAKDGR